jgi:hypothetical protein
MWHHYFSTVTPEQRQFPHALIAAASPKGSISVPLLVYERHRAAPGRARQLSYAVVAVEVR